MNGAWTTAWLTAVATNDPKQFPKSPETLLQKAHSQKPMNKGQWAVWIQAMTGAASPEAT